MEKTSMRGAAARIIAASVVAVGATLLPAAPNAAHAEGETWDTWQMDSCYCGFFPYHLLKPIGTETGRDISAEAEGKPKAWTGPDMFVSPNTSGTVTPYQPNSTLTGLRTRTLCFAAGRLSEAATYQMVYVGAPDPDNTSIFFPPQTRTPTSYLTHIKAGVANPKAIGGDFDPNTGEWVTAPAPYYDPSYPYSQLWGIDTSQPRNTVLPNGSLWGRNLSAANAGLFPAPFELKFNTGDSTWAYTAGALPDGADYVEYVIESVAMSEAAVTYPPEFMNAANYYWPNTVDAKYLDAKLGQAGALVTQRVVIVRPTTTVDDAIDLTSASSIDVRGNDHWVELAQPSLVSTTSPAYGTVTWDGTKVTYTPGPNFPGSDSFTYTVKDARTGKVTTATVRVTKPGTPVTPTTPTTPVAPSPTRPLPLTDAADSSLLPLVAVGFAAGAVWLRRRR